MTLKNVRTFEGHDTMQGFNADVYINGKKVFHAFDSAHGGMFEYTPVDSKSYNKTWKLIEELQEKLKTFPEYEVQWSKNKKSMFRDDLDIVIGALVEEHESKKHVKRLQAKGIVLEKKFQYETIRFKAGTIPEMLKKFDKKAVSMMVEGVVKRELKKGETIANLEYLKKTLGIKV